MVSVRYHESGWRRYVTAGIVFWLISLPSISLSVEKNNLCSNQPSPSLREPSGSPPQNISAGEKQETKKKQDETQYKTVLINLIETKNNKNEADQPKNIENEKASDDRAMVWITGGLGVFACLQWAAMVWQAFLLRKSVNSSEIATKAAIKQADIAEKALVGLERPYIFICPIEHEIPPKNYIPGQSNIYATLPKIKYGITNFGRVPSVIYEFSKGFALSSYIPDAPLFERNGVNGERIIASNGTDDGYIEEFSQWLTTDEWEEVLSEKRMLIFYGRIIYGEPIGPKKYETYFGLRYLPDHNILTAINKPAWNHRT